MSAALDRVEAFRRQVLNELLAQCTTPQQDMFKRVYPNGVPDSKVTEAILLCERTISENNRMANTKVE